MPNKWTRDAVLELARDYQSACVLAAAADLDLFSALTGEPRGAAAVADKLATDVRATTVLLDALSALRIIQKRHEQYFLPDETVDLVAEGGPESVLPMLQHQANCLRRWVQLADVVKTGRPTEREPSLRGEAQDEAAFIAAMDVICAPVASKIIADLGVPPFKHLLDVGGASGTWTIAWLRAYPEAAATLFDLPHVIPMAEERVTAAGVKERVRLVAGDFGTDPLPTGADLAWVSAIVHQNSREQNRRLFGAVANSLTGGGRILIRDVLMDDSRTMPVAGALFAINMLVATEAGGTFTFNELREDLEGAGFVDAVVLRHDDGMNSAVIAVKARPA